MAEYALEVSNEKIVAAFQNELSATVSRNVMLQLLVKEQAEIISKLRGELDAIQKPSTEAVPVRQEAEGSEEVGA